MPKVSDSVEVVASPDAIFEFIADEPGRASTFIPGLNRISHIKPPKAGVDQTWEFEFNWFGLVVSGNSRCTKYDKPSVYQFQTLDRQSEHVDLSNPAERSRRAVTLEVDFELPEGQIARFATAGALEQMNRNRAREIVANLKALIEP